MAKKYKSQNYGIVGVHDGKINRPEEVDHFLKGFNEKDQLKDIITKLLEKINGVKSLIPEEATIDNQLADKNYVNTKVSTDAATFRQTWNLVSDLNLTTEATHSDIESALATAITTADNNDYCHVQIPVADATPTKIAHTERYKFNGTTWGYEFDIADPSSVPTTLAELSDDSMHRLVSDTEKEAWNGYKDLLMYEDVYIGVAAQSSTVIDNMYHHDTIIRSRPIAFSNVIGYIWLVLPSNYSPIVLMNGIEVPMSEDSTTTVDDVTYKICKSVGSYTGTFNLYLL